MLTWISSLVPPFWNAEVKHWTVKGIYVGWRSNLKQSKSGVGKHRDNRQEGKQPHWGCLEQKYREAFHTLPAYCMPYSIFFFLIKLNPPWLCKHDSALTTAAQMSWQWLTHLTRPARLELLSIAPAHKKCVMYCWKLHLQSKATWGSDFDLITETDDTDLFKRLISCTAIFSRLHTTRKHKTLVITSSVHVSESFN